MTNLKPLIDVHTHSISSGHAYSTLQENVAAAKKAGLSYVGLSDHAPALPGAAHAYHFANLIAVPRVIDGVRVLRGAELNILNPQGEVDLEEADLCKLDYAIASLHGACYDYLHSAEENLSAYTHACANPYVKIIGHADDGRYPCDYQQLVKAAKETHTLIEINNSSLNPEGFRKEATKNIPILLQECKRQGCPIILGSDAHISYAVGQFERIEPYLQEADFPMDLIVNFNEALIEEYLLQPKRK